MPAAALSALMHGRAQVEQLEGELVFAVTEHGGVGMSAQQAEEAIRFGHHAAKPAATTLQNYSHNGIGAFFCSCGPVVALAPAAAASNAPLALAVSKFSELLYPGAPSVCVPHPLKL